MTIHYTRLTSAILFILVFGCNSQSEKTKTNSNEKLAKLTEFGTRYSSAWSSQQPYLVSAFFAKNGSLSINNGEPALGEKAIAKVVDGFMTDFPDLVVTMDSLSFTSTGANFYWTLTGTNSGPGGTDKKVKITGVEHWRFGNAGLLLESKRSFDANEYNRQLRDGAEQ